MKILFHSNQLSLRGTEVALYDYAHFNELYLNNESVVATRRDGHHHPLAVEKFAKRFKVIYYDTLAELQQYADTEKIDIFYAIKSGKNDGIVLNGVKNCIHAVFKHHDFHGDVYAYVSEWLSNEMTGGKSPYVPHMILLPEEDGDLRSQLGIPSSAIVFGRYGGRETFDLPFVKRVIYKVAEKRKDIFFLFMNTENFLEDKSFFRKKWINKIVSPVMFSKNKINNIIFLEGTADPIYKRKFIQTCDAMLHARRQGESFGITCGEFSICNKPVITCDAPYIRERSHIEILGNKGIHYFNYQTLTNILLRFKKGDSGKSWDAYSERFNPRAVMEKFKDVFIGH
ncbi:hypothetical protein Salpa_1207 [Sporomusa sp. KB1]|jgi:glycosyltransferase involved in cell wall biosynthesis|nr:hypothetical protein Salpa_1207 [Sporomusa sp. KB1]